VSLDALTITGMAIGTVEKVLITLVPMMITLLTAPTKIDIIRVLITNRKTT